MSLLSLEQFRQQVHYSPWHFWGFAGALAPVESQCNTVVKQYSWQTQNAVGRAEISQAIEEAEARLRDYLNYSVAPHYVAEEVRDYPAFYDKTLWARWPMGADGHWKAVRLREGYVQVCGIEQLDLIDTPTVLYLDADGDGLKESFSVSVATTVTDPLQIAVYFASGDRVSVYSGEPIGDRWRVQPLSVSISGGVATITGRAWLLAKPILYEAYKAGDLDPASAANFVSTLEVYQRSCDSTGTTLDAAEGKFIWETLPYPTFWGIGYGSSITDGSTDPSAYAYSIARVGVHGDGRLGFVIPGEAIYNPTTGLWNMTIPPWTQGLFRPPDKVEVRYRAGYPLDADGQMSRKFQTAVTRLALAQLDNKIAACDEANREITRWQRDMSQIADKTEMYRISNEDLACPFGTRRGAIDAWHQVRFLRLIRPVTTP